MGWFGGRELHALGQALHGCVVESPRLVGWELELDVPGYLGEALATREPKSTPLLRRMPIGEVGTGVGVGVGVGVAAASRSPAQAKALITHLLKQLWGAAPGASIPILDPDHVTELGVETSMSRTSVTATSRCTTLGMCCTSPG